MVIHAHCRWLKWTGLGQAGAKSQEFHLVSLVGGRGIFLCVPQAIGRELGHHPAHVWDVGGRGHSAACCVTALAPKLTLSTVV